MLYIYKHKLILRKLNNNLTFLNNNNFAPKSGPKVYTLYIIRHQSS